MIYGLEDKPMWSILYECEGTIYQIGPFQGEQGEAQAMKAACKAQADGEFSIYDQRVYIMGPTHRMIELSDSDLTN